MNDIAVVLSGHDDSCCRSHSLRNILLLIKVSEELNSIDSQLINVDIYVHPSEFLFLYKLLAKKLFINKSYIVKRNCKDLNNYNTIFGCYSTVFKGLIHNDIRIYDPALSDSLIKDSLGNVKILC